LQVLREVLLSRWVFRYVEHRRDDRAAKAARHLKMLAKLLFPLVVNYRQLCALPNHE
jgi:adenylate kinase family enzyme